MTSSITINCEVSCVTNLKQHIHPIGKVSREVSKYIEANKELDNPASKGAVCVLEELWSEIDSQTLLAMTNRKKVME